METKDLYPTPLRDTLDKIADCNAEYGADDLHTVVPQASNGSTSNPSKKGDKY